MERGTKLCELGIGLGLSHIEEAIFWFCRSGKAAASVEQRDGPPLCSLSERSDRERGLAPILFTSILIERGELQTCLAPLCFECGQAALHGFGFLLPSACTLQQGTRAVQSFQADIQLSVVESISGGFQSIGRHVINGSEVRIGDRFFLEGAL